jgi:hypothetical protein
MRDTVPESVFVAEIASPDVAIHAELSAPVPNARPAVRARIEPVDGAGVVVSDPQRAGGRRDPGGLEAGEPERLDDAIALRVDALDSAALAVGDPDRAGRRRDVVGDGADLDPGDDAAGRRVDAVDAPGLRHDPDRAVREAELTRRRVDLDLADDRVRPGSMPSSWPALASDTQTSPTAPTTPHGVPPVAIRARTVLSAGASPTAAAGNVTARRHASRTPFRCIPRPW